MNTLRVKKVGILFVVASINILKLWADPSYPRETHVEQTNSHGILTVLYFSPKPI